ncbi:MAG: IS1634 family transposase [Bacillota bacterium]
MYIRTISRKNKDGSVVRYVQLAHNYWDPQAGHARAQVLYSFGREEDVDREGLKRLIKSIARYLGPQELLQIQAASDGETPLQFVRSRPLGGAWALDQLWKSLQLDRLLERLLKQRKFRTEVERALLALVANRALCPLSKLATEDWVAQDTFIPGLPELSVQQAYRAMDFLVEAQAEFEREVYWQTANLLNLELDLLYFDTTSTYFEVDADQIKDEEVRQAGHSKDHRPDWPQVVIGLAVTRDGIPIRCWVWPGNTADMSVIAEVKRDLAGWKLGRVVTVVDRGFCSEDNLRELQRAGGHYIAGEKLRGGKAGAREALARAGRFQTVRDNLEVKEIVVGDGERRARYILVRNPEEVRRDRAKREEILERVRAELTRIGDLEGAPHTKACCALIAHPTLGRYVKTDKRGQPRLDRSQVAAEEKLDGKYLLRTSDDTLSAEDLALGYKQLYEVEDAFRTLKTTLELRPVYHRLEDRIRAHIILCWLALLLVRIASVRTGQTWAQLRRVLERVHVGEWESTNGTVLQRTELTQEQTRIFEQLKISPPPRFLAITPSAHRKAT